jgi:polar amino acid transport system permease protein
VRRRPPKRIRLTWLDVAVSAAIAAGLVFVAYRVDSHLVYRWRWAEIPQYFVRWDPGRATWVANVLTDGLLTTLRLAVWGIVLAAVIGLVMGLCRVSRHLFLRLVSRTYVELIRNLPPLVFMFVFYFFVASQLIPLLGADRWVRAASPGTKAVLAVLFGPPSFVPAFLSGLLCLAIFEAAYITEIVRAGIESIDRGQWEAAGAVGLSRWHTMRDVVLPQAIQRVVPPLAGVFISLIKDSSIVSLISIPEMTFQATELATASYLTFEVWLTVSAIYLVLCLGLSLAFGRLEVRLAGARR